MEHRERGNQLFKEKKYLEALKEYSIGIGMILRSLNGSGCENPNYRAIQHASMADGPDNSYHGTDETNGPQFLFTKEFFQQMQASGMQEQALFQPVRLALSTLFSNRASCHLNLNNYNEALQDCISALESIVLWGHSGTEAWNLLFDSSCNPIYRKMRFKLHRCYLYYKNTPQALRNILKADPVIKPSEDQLTELMSQNSVVYDSPLEDKSKMDHSMYLNGTWEKVNLNGTWFKGRCFHSCTRYNDTQCIVYGGMHPMHWTYYDDMFLIDVKEHSIKRIVYKSSRKPRRRKGHTAVMYNNNLWVLGGEAPLDMQSLDAASGELFWRFDLSQKTWTSIKTPSFVKVQADHSAVVYKDAMYVFGGTTTPPDGIDCNTLYKYSFKSNTWKIIKGKGSRPPSPRSLHTAFVMEDSMYISHGTASNTLTGARMEDCYCFLDTWKFDFKTHVWTRLAPCGNLPAVRSEFSSTVIHADTSQPRAVVFGGYGNTPNCTRNSSNPFMANVMYMNDCFEFSPHRPEEERLPNRNEFTSNFDYSWRMVLADKNKRPERRACGQMVTLRPNGKDEIYVVGGYYGMTNPYGITDCWKLNLNLKEAKKKLKKQRKKKKKEQKEKEEARQETAASKETKQDTSPPKKDTNGKICTTCQKTPKKLRRCPCHLVRYCSNQCQRTDWPRHREEHFKAIEASASVEE